MLKLLSDCNRHAPPIDASVTMMDARRSASKDCGGSTRRGDGSIGGVASAERLGTTGRRSRRACRVPGRCRTAAILDCSFGRGNQTGPAGYAPGLSRFDHFQDNWHSRSSHMNSAAPGGAPSRDAAEALCTHCYAVGDAIISMEQRPAFDPERATQTIEIDVEI